MDQSFPATARLHDRRDYGRVFHRQQKAAGRHAVLLVAPRPKRGPQRSRLGVMVSLKVDKRAVERHRIKRWVREHFRTAWQHRVHGHDLVVLMRRCPPAERHPEFDRELDRLLERAMRASPAPGTGRRSRGRS